MDNDLLTAWTKAGAMTVDQVRDLITEMQTARDGRDDAVAEGEENLRGAIREAEGETRAAQNALDDALAALAVAEARVFELETE